MAASGNISSKRGVRRALQNFVLSVCTGGGALLGLALGFPPDVDPPSGTIWDELGAILLPALTPALIGMTTGAALGLALCLWLPGLRTPKRRSSQ
jgi:hypothetical protein